jgi:hypothetical protein
MIFLWNKKYLAKWVVPYFRDNMKYISIFPYILLIFLAYSVVLSASIPDIDAQLLSGRQENGGGLLGGNLSSLTDSMFQGIDQRIDTRLNSTLQGIEQRIDTRLEPIKARMDEVAAVAVPAIIAAVAGIVAFAVLIVIYILLSWYDRFKAHHRHKRVLRNMYDLILKELKDNTVLLQGRSSLTKSISSQGEGESENESENIPVNAEVIVPHDLSTQALEAATSSQIYWDLTPNVQDVMFRLLRAVNGYNKVFGHALELRDSIMLNKTHKQTTEKLLADYESALNKYNQDINDLSKQLQDLIHTETSKGVLGVFRSGHKDDEGHS